MLTVLLLIGSNILMTIAWYGHLRFPDQPWKMAIFVSWLIAFFEYCLAVPANRIGYFEAGFTASQLKIMQEVISLSVFAVFSLLVLGERPSWNYLGAFFCLVGAVFFIFRE